MDDILSITQLKSWRVRVYAETLSTPFAIVCDKDECSPKCHHSAVTSNHHSKRSPAQSP